MPQSHLTVKILIILLVSIVVCVGCWVVISPKSPGPDADLALYERFDPACPLKIKGLTYISYENERRVMEMSMEELKIGPRKFMIFNIAEFNELTITNANIKLYLTNGHRNPRPFEVIEMMTAPMKSKKNSRINLGIVTRGVMKEVSLQIYTDKLLHLTVEAVGAEIDFKREKIEMKNARVEHRASGKSIFSSLILWDIERNRFKVPGKYIAQTPAGEVEGRKVEFDLDFVFKNPV